MHYLSQPIQLHNGETSRIKSIAAGEPFVKANYQLEGDGPLVLTVYEDISRPKFNVDIIQTLQ